MPPKDFYDDQQDLTETHASFEPLTRTIAHSSHSRSKVLKLMCTAVLGGALSFFSFPDSAQARRRRKRPQDTYAFAGSVAGSDRIQTSLLYDNNVPSTCNSPKTPPPLFTTGRYPYDVYTLKSGSAAACVVVTLITSPLCQYVGGELQSAVYIPSYNPADVQQNYVADSGTIPFSTKPSVYSFSVAANTTFSVVVTKRFTNENCPYALVVSGLLGLS